MYICRIRATIDTYVCLLLGAFAKSKKACLESMEEQGKLWFEEASGVLRGIFRHLVELWDNAMCDKKCATFSRRVGASVG